MGVAPVPRKESGASQPVAGYNGGVAPEELYFHLMKQGLTRMLWKEKYRPIT